MSDPRTPFLDLIKPIVNDEAGEDLWGDKLNSNFDRIDLFASNISGGVTDAPQDNKLYGRGTPNAWIETITKTAFDTFVASQDLRDDSQDNAVANKAPLGPNDSKLYGWQGTS